ncbi:MAG TPA: GAF domain-containing protein [Candidatus Acidoferrum sp.]|nr:GAF domain-containing protein [Candidatus Acidoferrum sp.]
MKMTGTEEKDLLPQAPSREGSTHGSRGLTFDALRVRAQQLSLREQMERQHFLLERLNAASARLLQAIELDDVYEAIGEIIGNLIGCEEVAIFQHHSTEQTFSQVWSTGVEKETLQQLGLGAGLVGRSAHEGTTQFRDRQPNAPLLPYESRLTACIPLKLDREVIGVIVILGLLPQKNGLEWADFELLKYLEMYGAIAVQLQNLRKNSVKP